MLYTVLVPVNESVKILWDEQDQPSRGPKPALDARRIARAAIAIADAEGLGAVSMQRVAAEFEFTTMALYRYVPNKTALVELMVDEAGNPAPDLSRVKGGWRPRIEEWARRARQLYLNHPWMLRAIPVRRRVMGPNELAWLDAALAALAGSGLTHAEQHTAFIVLIGLVRTAAQQEADAGGAEHDEAWGRAMGELMQRHGTRFPALHASLAAGVFGPSGGDSFEFGLSCVLDGLAKRTR